jgi:uncharacterized membrane protein YidH (DUF202 family)
MESKEKTQTPVKKNKTGIYIIGIAILILILGYYILSKVNADASNWQGIAAPILIIGGYILIAIGILVGWYE